MAGFNQKALAVANLIFFLSTPSQSLDIKVHKDSELLDISPLLYGYAFEEVNGAGDGGFHSQKLRNNGFQGDKPSLDAYGPIGDVELSVDTENPLSDAIPNSLAVTILSDSADPGFSNNGYYGIIGENGNYTCGFYMKGDYQGSISVRLVDNKEGIPHGGASLNVDSSSSEFRYFETPFPAERTEDLLHWELTFDDEVAAEETFYFDLIQLWEPQIENMPRQQNRWLARNFKDTKPSFLHFPGGNDLIGNTADTRWKWNETIGELKDRPGRTNAWGYPTTDELGLVEYFNWCEDIGMAPVLGLYAGLSIDGEEVITGDDLTPYVEDAMNELEYILGSTSTKYGALRESHGYPDPFPLEHVEIGYEDDVNNGGPSYADRFLAFHDAIHGKYPNMTIIASNMDHLPDPLPENTWVDFHIHSSPDELVDSFDMWDAQDRDVPVVVGEFACTSRADGSPLQNPEMQGTVAEAVYLIGVERNSDVVKMASYGYILQNVQNTQTGPSLAAFTNLLETTSDGDFGPVYWVASHSSTQYFVKMANYSPEPQPVTVEIEYARDGKLHIMSHNNATAHNSMDYGQDAGIYPDNKPLRIDDQHRFNFTLAPWSVAVLEAYARE
ncbi:hypothetical protein FQN54_006027 [Arachnomyces sp. PD_36]|nr:hypothetical protein FQN54_006027 [Arachnomyces sp. PD_36]